MHVLRYSLEVSTRAVLVLDISIVKVVGLNRINERPIYTQLSTTLHSLSSSIIRQSIGSSKS